MADQLSEEEQADIFYGALQSMLEPLSKQQNFFSSISISLLGKVIDNDDAAKIRLAECPSDQAIKFVDILGRKGKNNFPVLQRAFQRAGMPVLKRALEESWVQAEKEFRSS